MSKQAVAALEAFHHRIVDVAKTFSDAEWIAPSACAGWRVRDVISHLADGARFLVDPLPDPPELEPLPSDRERQHDIHVDMRSGWTTAEVLEEFEHFGAERLTRLPGLQEEPLASTEIEVPGLGTYPIHAGANGWAFDHFSHLYLDLTAPRGPIERDLPPVTDDEMDPVIEWMFMGLPQMQGPELEEALHAPVTINLTGPGGGTRTVSRSEESGGLVVTEGDDGEVTVTSAATDFVAWGTGRTPWRSSCEVDGDVRLVGEFLSTLSII